MPAEIAVPAAWVGGFMLTLVRVSALVAMLPIPGFKAAPDLPRACFALGLTLALSARWPAVDLGSASVAQISVWMLTQAAVGLATGMVAAFALDILVLFAQIAGMQAGYSFASTFDPSTQADSGVLLVFAQLTAGLMFFALGFDREILRTLTISWDTTTAAPAVLTGEAARNLLRMGSGLFSSALRLALPVAAFLLIVDIALGIFGRLAAQLQIVTMAFPIKMALGLLLIGLAARHAPAMLARQFQEGAEILRMVAR
jgi:flagellar biosynthetic protein FliR